MGEGLIRMCKENIRGSQYEGILEGPLIRIGSYSGLLWGFLLTENTRWRGFADLCLRFAGAVASGPRAWGFWESALGSGLRVWGLGFRI